jgi:hypothetical protein
VVVLSNWTKETTLESGQTRTGRSAVVPIREFGCGGPGGGGHVLVTMADVSGGGERVVAGLGQVVAGLVG